MCTSDEEATTHANEIVVVCSCLQVVTYRQQLVSRCQLVVVVLCAQALHATHSSRKQNSGTAISKET